MGYADRVRQKLHKGGGEAPPAAKVAATPAAEPPMAAKPAAAVAVATPKEAPASPVAKPAPKPAAKAVAPAAPADAVHVGSGEILSERDLTPPPAPPPAAAKPPPLAKSGGKVLELGPGVSSDMLALAREVGTQPHLPAVGAAPKEESVPIDVGSGMLEIPSGEAVLEPSGAVPRAVSEPPTTPVSREEMDRVAAAAEGKAPPAPPKLSVRAPAAAKAEAKLPTVERIVGTAFKGQTTTIGSFKVAYIGTDALGKNKRFSISGAGRDTEITLSEKLDLDLGSGKRLVLLDRGNLGVKATLVGEQSELVRTTARAKGIAQKVREGAKYYMSEIILVAVNAVAVPVAVAQLDVVKNAPGWMKLLLGVYVLAQLGIAALSARAKNKAKDAEMAGAEVR